jgi:hypothetical protein
MNRLALRSCDKELREQDAHCSTLRGRDGLNGFFWQKQEPHQPRGFFESPAGSSALDKLRSPSGSSHSRHAYVVALTVITEVPQFFL